MNKVAGNKLDILRKLSLVPDNSLEKVKEYLDMLLADEEKGTTGEKCLKGIWRGSDFEKLVDLEVAVREARKELQGNILNKAM